MKKSLKIDKFSNERFTNEEMNKVKGGAGCCCGCHYEGNGGSSVEDNDAANDAGGLHSPNCSTVLVVAKKK